MSAYRVYCLDEDGLVVKARLIEAANDAEAMIVAADVVRSGGGQLWTGTRLVGVLKDGEVSQSSAGQ